MEALLSQHPTRALPLYLTNLHHNRQPNLSKCTPTNLIRALLTQPKLRPLLLTLCWQWSISPYTPLLMMLQTSPRFFQPRGLDRSKSVNTTSSSMPITPTISWWTTPSDPLSHQQSVGGLWCQWRPCWFRHASHLQNPLQDQHFRH